MEPDVPGACVISDCIVGDQTCPPGFKCCDFPPVADPLYDGHNLCLPDEAWQEVVDTLDSCDG